MPAQINDWKNLHARIEELKKSGSIDLSMEEDLSIGVMNLISLEEHFFFTGAKTGKPEYYDFLVRVREVRKKLLAKLVSQSQHEGETWCIVKHLLGATMRLMEVGSKLQADGKKSEAEETFAYGYRIYSLFWALRLKLIDAAGFKAQASAEKPWTLQDIVKELVNCCDE